MHHFNSESSTTVHIPHAHSLGEDLVNQLVGKESSSIGSRQLPLGHSLNIQRVREQIAQVADFDATVLITGPSGAGKEVIARQIHEQSPRSDKPFIAINCGAIPDELLESEMFGHEKGAFTGAISSRAGRFELAQGGTLFLDEIGDMPLMMQVKLLRVLQEKCFERVGGVKSISTDVRIITATHRNLEDLIKRNEFREDLFYRLNVFPINVSALNKRQEDVSILLDHFIAKLSAQSRFSLTPEAYETLTHYAWPGNVRELENMVQRLAILHRGQSVGVHDLPMIRLMRETVDVQDRQLSSHRYIDKLEQCKQENETRQLSSFDAQRSNQVVAQTGNQTHNQGSLNTQGFLHTQVSIHSEAALESPVQTNTPINTGADTGVSTYDLLSTAYDDRQGLHQSTYDESAVSNYGAIEQFLPKELGKDGFDLKLSLRQIEEYYILKALDQTGGVVAKAARLLSLRRTTLVEKMKKLGISSH